MHGFQNKYARLIPLILLNPWIYGLLDYLSFIDSSDLWSLDFLDLKL